MEIVIFGMIETNFIRSSTFRILLATVYMGMLACDQTFYVLVAGQLSNCQVVEVLFHGM
jgi:hypothetical protein